MVFCGTLVCTGGVLMKEYVDFILKKEKKPIDMVKLYKKIEKIKQIHNQKFLF